MPRSRSRRSSAGVLALLVAAALVAGCASSPSASSVPASGASASATAQRTTYPLTITQPDGTQAIIPKAPTRIVTVNNPSYAVEYLVALGVEPIGGEIYPAGSSGLEYDSRGVPAVVSSQVTAFTSVGTAPNQPDLEAIVALTPDLIVGGNGKTAYDTPLQAIAPLVSIYPESPPGPGIQSQNWYPEMALLAKILDRQAEFDAFLAQFEAAAAAARPALTGKTVRLVSAQGENLYIPGPGYFPSPVLTYLGLIVPPAPDGGSFLSGSDTTNGIVKLSLERASELTGDYLMFESTVGGAAAQQAFLSNPVTQQLPSVKAGRVIVSGPGTPLGNINGGPLDILAGIPNYPKAFEAGR
ncbi:ABC transporter substrate-binding protein [Pseudonocardia sp. GCM10023141]|uniref:ABC transporter substrate-binding protein n=1 Tax=Pseudonocardia sp. GCM10023141 TaxID=3252653 RepID=UPI003613E166